jgi:hypothetical protein
LTYIILRKMLEVTNILPRHGYQDDVELIRWYP